MVVGIVTPNQVNAMGVRRKYIGLTDVMIISMDCQPFLGVHLDILLIDEKCKEHPKWNDKFFSAIKYALLDKGVLIWFEDYSPCLW